MTRLVPVVPGPDVQEDCAACAASGTPRYRVVLSGIDMSLCVNWKECCLRMDQRIILAARADTKRRNPFVY